MKLVNYIENPSEVAVIDNVSMASSSIYTSPEKPIIYQRRNEGYEKSDESSNYESVAFSMLSFKAYDRSVPQSSRHVSGVDDESVQSNNYIENDTYNMLDIERQLDDISTGVSSKMSHIRSWHASIENSFRDENNVLDEQQLHPPEVGMDSCMPYIPRIDHSNRMAKDISTKTKPTRYSIYLFSACLLGAVVLIILLAVLVSNSDDNDVALNAQSVTNAPTHTPTTTEQVQLNKPTLNPAYLQGDGECVDDNEATIRLGSDHRDCAWLATHEASQVIFCQDIYPYVYNVCKATCRNCNNHSSPNEEGQNMPTEAPTPDKTLEVLSQSLTNATQQQSTTSSQNMIEQGATTCLDESDATIVISPYESINCTWLSSHPASQIIFCRPQYFPLVYDACRSTCKNCD
jgi:hypothetical protein